MKLFSYWTGPITWIERLSIASAHACGHSLTIFTPNPAFLSHEGLGCTIEDVGDLYYDSDLEKMRREIPSHYSDHIRLEGLAKGLGTWCDLDVIHLKPLPECAYLFGWESEDSINGAILHLPADSKLLAEYLDILRERPVKLNLPWLPLGRRIRRRIQSVTRPLRGKRGPAPMLGPCTLTYLVHKHGLERCAQPRKVLYPLPAKRVVLKRCAEEGFIQSQIGPETRTVHLYRSTFTKLHGSLLAPCQWLKDAYWLHCGEQLRPWQETIPRAVGGRPRLTVVGGRAA